MQTDQPMMYIVGKVFDVKINFEMKYRRDVSINSQTHTGHYLMEGPKLV